MVVLHRSGVLSARGSSEGRPPNQPLPLPPVYSPPRQTAQPPVASPTWPQLPPPPPPPPTTPPQPPRRPLPRGVRRVRRVRRVLRVRSTAAARHGLSRRPATCVRCGCSARRRPSSLPARTVLPPQPPPAPEPSRSSTSREHLPRSPRPLRGSSAGPPAQQSSPSCT